MHPRWYEVIQSPCLLMNTLNSVKSSTTQGLGRMKGVCSLLTLTQHNEGRQTAPFVGYWGMRGSVILSCPNVTISCHAPSPHALRKGPLWNCLLNPSTQAGSPGACDSSLYSIFKWFLCTNAVLFIRMAWGTTGTIPKDHSSAYLKAPGITLKNVNPSKTMWWASQWKGWFFKHDDTKITRGDQTKSSPLVSIRFSDVLKSRAVQLAGVRGQSCWHPLLACTNYLLCSPA